jgi:hypothetical protein
VLAFVVLYIVGGAAGLFLDHDAGASVAVALFAVFILYCAARPADRLNVLLNAGAPGGVGTILHDLIGISRLWGLALVPFVLVTLHEIDRRQAS